MCVNVKPESSINIGSVNLVGFFVVEPQLPNIGFQIIHNNHVSCAIFFAMFSVYLVKAAAAAGFISPVKKQQLINRLLLLMDSVTDRRTD